MLLASARNPILMSGFETVERARSVYGVALVGSVADETLAVDAQETRRLRGGPAKAAA